MLAPGFILPHSRSLSGLSCAIRFFTSSTRAASKRFFIRKALPESTHHNQSYLTMAGGIALAVVLDFEGAAPFRVKGACFDFSSRFPDIPKPSRTLKSDTCLIPVYLPFRKPTVDFSQHGGHSLIQEKSQ